MHKTELVYKAELLLFALPWRQFHRVELCEIQETRSTHCVHFHSDVHAVLYNVQRLYTVSQNIHDSQGSVATRLRCGGVFNGVSSQIFRELRRCQILKNRSLV